MESDDRDEAPSFVLLMIECAVIGGFMWGLGFVILALLCGWI